MNNESRSIDDLISLTEASQLSGYSEAHLRRLVEHGQIWGKKISRNWLTTKEAIEEYTSQKHPRGRKPMHT